MALATPGTGPVRGRGSGGELCDDGVEAGSGLGDRCRALGVARRLEIGLRGLHVVGRIPAHDV